MFCPYAVDRNVVQQTTYEYSESGEITQMQLIERNHAAFAKCKQEQCGAWHDGQCGYYKS